MRFRGFPQAAAAPHGTPKLSYRPSSEVEPEAAEPPVAQRYLSAEPAAPSPTEDICTPLRAGLRQLPGLRVRRAIRVELHAAIVTVHVVMRLRHRSIPVCLPACKLRNESVQTLCRLDGECQRLPVQHSTHTRQSPDRTGRSLSRRRCRPLD